MEIVELIHQSRLITWNLVYILWKGELFSSRWFALVSLMVIFYVVWWILIDKRRLSDLLLFGSFIAVLRVLYENTFVGMGAWTYQVRIFPLTINLFMPDLTMVPLAFMLIYQYTASWKSYFLGSIVASGIWAFAVTPLFKVFDIIVFHNWNYFYSFIAALLTALLARFFFLLVIKIEQGKS